MCVCTRGDRKPRKMIIKGKEEILSCRKRGLWSTNDLELKGGLLARGKESSKLGTRTREGIVREENKWEQGIHLREGAEGRMGENVRGGISQTCTSSKTKKVHMKTP